MTKYQVKYDDWLTRGEPKTLQFLLELFLGGDDNLKVLYRNMGYKHQSTDSDNQLCWRWSGTTDQLTGLALFRIPYPYSQYIPAHVVAWCYHNNQVMPSGKWAYRSCNELDCVNPHHIYLSDAPWYTP